MSRAELDPEIRRIWAAAAVPKTLKNVTKARADLLKRKVKKTLPEIPVAVRHSKKTKRISVNPKGDAAWSAKQTRELREFLRSEGLLPQGDKKGLGGTTARFREGFKGLKQGPKPKVEKTKAPTKKAPTKKAPTKKAPTKKAPTKKAPAPVVPAPLEPLKRAPERITSSWEKRRSGMLQSIEDKVLELGSSLYRFVADKDASGVRKATAGVFMAIQEFLSEAEQVNDPKVAFYEQALKMLKDVVRRGLPQGRSDVVFPAFVNGAESLVRIIRNNINVEKTQGIDLSKTRSEPARDPQEVAKTILNQMGGAASIKLMTGASQFLTSPDGVSFKFPNRKRSKPNSVRIAYQLDDTYKVDFHRVGQGGLSVKDLGTYEGVYADQLKELFERKTGLDLGVPVVISKSIPAELAPVRKEGRQRRLGPPYRNCSRTYEVG